MVCSRRGKVYRKVGVQNIILDSVLRLRVSTINDAVRGELVEPLSRFDKLSANGFLITKTALAITVYAPDDNLAFLKK